MEFDNILEIDIRLEQTEMTSNPEPWGNARRDISARKKLDLKDRVRE